MPILADKRFRSKYISAYEMEEFLRALAPETEDGQKIIHYATAYLHSTETIDYHPDSLTLHRCPLCRRFPSLEYQRSQFDGTPMLVISARCNCTVGVRVTHLFPKWAMELKEKDAEISEAEHSAQDAWNSLVERRKKGEL